MTTKSNIVSIFLTENQKKSLFRLLSEDDPETTSLVRQQLINQGESGVPELEGWLKEVHGTPIERHLLEILGRLKYGHCDTEFLEFCNRVRASNDFDLEDGSFLLASAEYPSIDMSRYRAILDHIAEEVARQREKETLSEIEVLSFVLHERFRFRGNRDRYYEAENTYLNRVLERKMGIPLTLSLLYILVGKRLDIAIQGVALPGHFLVSWQKQFFDPFNHGRLLNEQACQQMVEARGQKFTKEQLNPATSRQVLSRMLMNLARVYEIEEDRPRFIRIRKYLQALGVI